MGPAELSQLVAARAAALAFYSPYYFLRRFAEADQQRLFGTGLAASWGQQEHIVENVRRVDEIILRDSEELIFHLYGTERRLAFVID